MVTRWDLRNKENVPYMSFCKLAILTMMPSHVSCCLLGRSSSSPSPLYPEKLFSSSFVEVMTTGNSVFSATRTLYSKSL